jgi:hypothetical protein
MSELTVGQLRGLPVNNNIVTVPAGHTLYAPGHVIQVVNVENVTRHSQGISSNSTIAISGMEATITPKSPNSKIIIQARWFGEFSATPMTWDSMFGISRNGVAINSPPDRAVTNGFGITSGALTYYLANGDSTPETASLFVSDSPNTTSPVTYRMTVWVQDGGTIFTNRVAGWSSVQSFSYELGTSSMMLMEIAQ